MKRFNLAALRLGSKPPAGSLRARFSRPRVAAAAGAGVLVLGLAGHHVYQHHHQHYQETRAGNGQQDGRRVVLLPATLVEGIAGGLGEVLQTLVLYPLDTIKVRCQAHGMTSKAVVRQLLRSSCNSVSSVITQLYAGALGAALCSVLVGSVHYASYETSKRLLLQSQHRQQQHAGDKQQQGMQPIASSSAPELTNAASTHTCCTSQRSEAHFDVLASSQQESAAAAVLPIAQAQQHVSSSAASVTGSSSNAAATDGSSYHAEQQQQQQQHKHGSSGSGGLAVNILAALCAAAATAVVESPVELFRHNQQAGLTKGNFLPAMIRTVRRQGLRGLYWGFLPHCFEAWPHDIAEMMVMGGMKDMHVEGQHPGSRHHWWTQKIPVEVWDLTVGAASGTAAVLVSMPLDSIKTYMQVHGADMAGKGLLGSARLFWATGQHMAATKGLGSFFYGITPRLAQQVPSAMLGWWTVHAVMRNMEPWTSKS